MTDAAHAASRTADTYLASHFRVIRGRRGKQKAIGAVRHDILVAYWHIVSKREGYHDLGPDWHQRRYNPEKQTQHSSANSNGFATPSRYSPPSPADRLSP